MKFFILLFSFLFLQQAFSATEIIYIKGEVKVNNQPTKLKHILKVGDVVTTGIGALGIIKIENRATIKLVENSTIEISTLIDLNKPVSLILKAGSIFSKVLEKAPKGQTNFQIRAKSAIMGVRGTEFFTAFSPKENKVSDDLWMCVNEGIVAISNTQTKEIIEVKEGEGVFIKKGYQSSKPRPFEWTKKLNWNLDPSLGELGNNALDELYSDLLDQDYD